MQYNQLPQSSYQHGTRVSSSLTMIPKLVFLLLLCDVYGASYDGSKLLTSQLDGQPAYRVIRSIVIGGPTTDLPPKPGPPRSSAAIYLGASDDPVSRFTRSAYASPQFPSDRLPPSPNPTYKNSGYIGLSTSYYDPHSRIARTDFAGGRFGGISPSPISPPRPYLPISGGSFVNPPPQPFKPVQENSGSTDLSAPCDPHSKKTKRGGLGNNPTSFSRPPSLHYVRPVQENIGSTDLSPSCNPPHSRTRRTAYASGVGIGNQ